MIGSKIPTLDLFGPSGQMRYWRTLENRGKADFFLVGPPGKYVVRGADDPENLTLSKKCGSSINCQQHENKTISKMTITPKIHFSLFFILTKMYLMIYPMWCILCAPGYSKSKFIYCTFKEYCSCSSFFVTYLLLFSRILSQHLLTKRVYAKAQRMLQLIKYLIKY